MDNTNAPYKSIVLHVCKYIDGLNRKCSHDCIFCFENVDIEKSNKILPSIEMIADVLTNITKCNKKHGVDKLEVVYIAGGEPTMREDICDIITLVSKTSNKVFLSSHADYEGPGNLIRNIKNAGVTNMSISLHGPDSKTHEFVTRIKGSFENTMRAIKVCFDKDIKVSINCVITALNVSKILDILMMLNSNCQDISDITFTHYRYSGIASEQTILDFNSFDFSHEIKKAIDYAKKIPFSVMFRDFPLCLDKRLVNYNSYVASYFVVIWDDPQTYSLYSEQSGKTFLPKCECCALKKDCSGILAANFYKYNKYIDRLKFDDC